MESLFDLWGKRDPEWEKKYQDTVRIPFTDYGKGVNQYQDVRGKIFGPGYEMFILAFFIGLYYDQTKPLVEDKAKRKHFGWPICEWGSREARLGRTKYSDLQRYMYAALIAALTIFDLLEETISELSNLKSIRKMAKYSVPVKIYKKTDNDE